MNQQLHIAGGFATFLTLVACTNEAAAPAPQPGMAGAAATSSNVPASNPDSTASFAPSAADSSSARPSPGTAARGEAVAGSPSSATPSPAPASQPAPAGTGTANAAGSAAPPTTPPAADGCEIPSSFTHAARTTLALSWPDTVGIVGGTGSVVFWSKITYIRDPDGTYRLESRPCGTQTPTVTTTALVGGLKSSVQVPFSAFDSPSMPTSRMTLTPRADGSLSIASASVLGATLDDPAGTWPASAELASFDHDGDGAPGLTALPVEGPEYLTPPSSVSQTEFLDRVYIASRVQLQVSLALRCSGVIEGAVEPLHFNYSIVGCHVQDRDACTAAEVRFLANQSPRFMLGNSATWLEVEVPATANCADVRGALPPP